MQASHDEGLELARALATPAAYPEDPSAARGVRWIQTHISHVFLTGERVYKLRKPVRLSFLDFSSARARNEDCLRELALNRRLAPDVYLGVAPVSVRAGTAQVGRIGETLEGAGEHVVVMRRLREGCDALSLLARGALGAGAIDSVAERLARFHTAHALGRPAPFTPEEWRERVARPMRANVAALREDEVVGRAAVAALASGTERARAAASDRREQRRRDGRAVDGHGDLHLQHIWFEGGAADPILIDCIEFADDLRQIDAASEIAFLAMDLRYRGARSLGERFLRRYAALRDDFDLYGVVDLYGAYRAAVRAKVAGLAAGDVAIGAAQREQAAESARRHVALALELLAEPAPAPLVLVCGTVGTGKSTVAGELADACDGVVISSDRTRKALAGIAALDHGVAHGRELYADPMTERAYAALLARAEPVLRSGRVALLDATFARAAHRERARELAARVGARALLVEATCAEPVARERVAARAARGDDPSDAGTEQVAASRARFEPTAEWEPSARFEIATDAPGWRARAAAVARQLAGLTPASRARP